MTTETKRKYESLRKFLNVIYTGPLGLRDALIGALAYVDGSVPYVDELHVKVLGEHTGGWFADCVEIRKLIDDIRECQRDADVKRWGNSFDTYG